MGEGEGVGRAVEVEGRVEGVQEEGGGCAGAREGEEREGAGRGEGSGGVGGGNEGGGCAFAVDEDGVLREARRGEAECGGGGYEIGGGCGGGGGGGCGGSSGSKGSGRPHRSLHVVVPDIHHLPLSHALSRSDNLARIRYACGSVVDAEIPRLVPGLQTR